MVESEGFVVGMANKIFCYPECKQDYLKLWENLKLRIPDSSTNLEAFLLKDSGHTDQSDGCIFDSYLACLFNLGMGCSFNKAEGSNTEFNEFITLLWLNYLHKIGFHENTFTIESV